MKLIIVESPTKAKTISQFLGKDFRVESSFGHVRDLPVSRLGVDIDQKFTPHYIIPQKAKARVTALKKAAQNAIEIILATDEDREGEAIAWHLVQALGLVNQKSEIPASPKLQRGERNPKHIERIVFHEITKKAIEEALAHPRDIDMHLVDAQQARRVLDRLVGYKLSPFLWKKLMRGLSAGRVQSVALRLVAERETEREAFKTQEYWTVIASLKTKNQKPKTQNIFEALLIKKGGETFDKFAIKNKEAAETIAKELEKATYQVSDAQKKQTQKNPLPPHTTSTLQQDASQRLGFSAKQTMRIAQQLYETGLITYMRTDSVNLSYESRRDAAAYLTHTLGASYALSPEGRAFKTKTKGAQEAHEAIRPTDLAKKSDDLALDTHPKKLYELIWRRFLASQTQAAIIDSITIDVSASPAYVLRATGQTVRFDGFLALYPLSITERELPPIEKGERLTLEKVIPAKHFTEPPPRFTEATLIKTLEQNGVGRPSTYAPTLALLQDRGYVEKDERKRLYPSVIGKKITEMLVAHFPRVVDIQFTAHMEEELDQIAAGRLQWQPVIEEFYAPFAEHLEEKYASVEKISLDRPSEEHCEKCGKQMVIKHGRFGEFLACSGFPDCKNTKKIPPSSIGIACPECNEGELVTRSTKKGRKFYGCSRYPACNYSTWKDPRSYVANSPPTPDSK